MNECNIACHLHDYVEIACLYGYQLRITLKNQQHLEGKAIDLVTVEKREYLVLDTGQAQQIELTQLAKLDVLTPHAQFTEVVF